MTAAPARALAAWLSFVNARIAAGQLPRGDEPPLAAGEPTRPPAASGANTGGR